MPTVALTKVELNVNRNTRRNASGTAALVVNGITI